MAGRAAHRVGAARRLRHPKFLALCTTLYAGAAEGPPGLGPLPAGGPAAAGRGGGGAGGRGRDAARAGAGRDRRAREGARGGGESGASAVGRGQRSAEHAMSDGADGFLYGGPVDMQVAEVGPLAYVVWRHRVPDGRLETRVVPPGLARRSARGVRGLTRGGARMKTPEVRIGHEGHDGDRHEHRVDADRGHLGPPGGRRARDGHPDRHRVHGRRGRRSHSRSPATA